MEQTDFSVQIDDAWKRVTRMRERTTAHEPTPETYEELRVADEELTVQQEEIERAREATEAARVKYEALFEFVPDAYLVTDSEGVILEANRAATQLLNVSRRFLVGKPFISFVAGDERRLLRDLLLRLRRTPRVPDFTIKIRPRRSDTIDATLTVAATRDREGRLTGFRWMVRDISAQTRSQAEVRKLNDELWTVKRELKQRAQTSLQRYLDIFQFAEQALAVDGPDGQPLQEVNPAFAQMHGYSPQEMAGGSSLMIVPEHEQARYREQQKLAETKGHHVFETVHRNREGREFPVEIDSTGVWGSEGEVLYRIVSVTDITERKSAEAAISSAYEREHKIAEALQQSLLVKPSPTAFPLVEIETFYEPAMSEAMIGGDFYDALPLPDGQVALLVGDVAGKGLAAAEQMAAVKHLLRAFLWSSPDPAQAIALLNDFLCDAAQRFNLVVVALAVLNPETGEGIYISGGADHALIVRAPGGALSKTEQLDAEGMLLGVEPSVAFSKSDFRLAPGDWLLMATDGVTEARQGTQFLGIDGLVRFAQGAAPLSSLRERGEMILGQTRAFAGGALRDDACLLLAQRNPRVA